MLASELLAHKRRWTKKRRCVCTKVIVTEAAIVIMVEKRPSGRITSGSAAWNTAWQTTRSTGRRQDQQQTAGSPGGVLLSWTFSCVTTPYRAERLVSSSTWRPYMKIKRLLIENLVACGLEGQASTVQSKHKQRGCHHSA